MARFLKKGKKEKGLPPGTLVFVGEQKMKHPIINLLDYNATKLKEKKIDEYAEIKKYKDSSTVTWLNIYGVHDQHTIEQVGVEFNLSPLLLEDVMNTGQRPKVIEYEKCTFVVLKMLRFDERSEKIISEQLSIVIADNFLITFQEQKGDVFEPVRDRLRQGRQRIRSSGPDFLAYALLDVVCENYINIIEIIGEKIDELEEVLLNSPSKAIIKQISRYKQEINYLRKCIRPVRDLVNQITKSENLIIKHETLVYW